MIGKMKIKILLIILVSIFYSNSSLFPQGFLPPPKGKAVVYFVRNKYYYGIPISYIHNNNYIGELKGRDYLRYECDTGEQLFWTYTIHKPLFIRAELKEGGTYLVNYGTSVHDPGTFLGPGKAEIELFPVTPYSKDVFEESKKLIHKKAPVVVPRDTIVLMNKTMKKEINKTLEKFNSQWQHEGKFRQMTRDMAIPTEFMK